RRPGFPFGLPKNAPAREDMTDLRPKIGPGPAAGPRVPGPRQRPPAAAGPPGAPPCPGRKTPRGRDPARREDPPPTARRSGSAANCPRLRAGAAPLARPATSHGHSQWRGPPYITRAASSLAAGAARPGASHTPAGAPSAGAGPASPAPRSRSTSARPSLYHLSSFVFNATHRPDLDHPLAQPYGPSRPLVSRARGAGARRREPRPPPACSKGGRRRPEPAGRRSRARHPRSHGPARGARNDAPLPRPAHADRDARRRAAVGPDAQRPAAPRHRHALRRGRADQPHALHL